MVDTNQYLKLLYEHEVLWARYDIKDHYLNKVVQEIFENVGQVLSLVRVQLSLLSDDKNSNKVSASEPSNLIAKVIQDLRVMCRNFYPETELLAKLGFIQTLEFELNLLSTDHTGNLVKVEGSQKSLAAGTELIVLCMLQQIFSSIKKEYKDGRIQVRVSYEQNAVTFIIDYGGKPVEWKLSNLHVNSHLSTTRLNLLGRAELINATLDVTHNKADQTSIKFVVPFKTSLYE